MESENIGSLSKHLLNYSNEFCRKFKSVRVYNQANNSNKLFYLNNTQLG